MAATKTGNRPKTKRPKRNRGGQRKVMRAGEIAVPRAAARDRYDPPSRIQRIDLRSLLERIGRLPRAAGNLTLALPGPTEADKELEITLFYVGDLQLLEKTCVAIVGTREVTSEGAARARRLARELASAGAVVVSGLARGVDTEALESAVEAGGKMVAVIGTPLDVATPSQNRWLQEEIYRHHLLISQFTLGSEVYPTNFPRRNKVMALLSDATVIIEASDTSGTLHQAAECVRRGRWLFIAKSVVENPKLSWPRKFLKNDCVRVLDSTDNLLKTIAR